MVIQTNTFICEVPDCNRLVSKTEYTSLYSDPVVTPPKGWDFLSDENTYACEDCVMKEDS